ncbi:S9 family peptidase [Sphingomonas sp. SRS2]|uniref:S9 family peptidase n=1 Tax=Sphingomonas sp. SRS2 TaxID=133190 RepID=UPI0006184459|nr:S9 family peptidase [Sphingomonas sp. SRS2]KKC25572.1 peptidase S9 [Sphingomonas sp. SRS2]
MHRATACKGAASALAALIALISAPLAARPLTIDDVVMLSRIGAPVVSADGRWLVWAQRETDLAANKGRYDLWKLDLSRRDARPTTLAAAPETNEKNPQIVGETVYFSSDSGGEDAVWAVPITGGTPHRVTDFMGGMNGFKVAPTGDRILIWADRKAGAPTLEPALEKKSPYAGDARVYDQLFVRHWDAWSNHERQQLFVVPFAGGAAPGNGRAIVGGLVGDTPSRPFGDSEELAWSPDGRTVYFAMREAGRIEALSTNLDIFAAPADGSRAPINLTAGNKATDTQPSVSPDGRKLAWLAMRRPGYEADRQVLTVRDLATGQTTSLTERWDRSIGSIAWAHDSASLYVTAGDTQETPLWRVDARSGAVTRLTGDGTVAAVAVTRSGAIVSMNSLTAPDDFYRITDRRAAPQRLTAVNAGRLAGIDLPQVTKFHFNGAQGDTVWGYAVKPHDAAAKVPIAYVVHGGPQSTSNNSWSYRWNPALFAGAGYGLVAVDFHGSTGYGQAFTDSIRNNWGGWPLDDLQKGLAAAAQQFSWLDEKNVCALGPSFGGYMMNWIEGRWPDRFKCIVQHDGIFDMRAVAYETEELWFPEWDYGGVAYHEDPAAFEKWNPVNHVDKWKTPQLVITGEKDYRIPYSQGIAAFTALQRRNIPSRLLVFPNENHWVLTPQNSRRWYGEVIGWLDRWTGKAAR